MRTAVLKPCKTTYDKCAKLINDGFVVAFPTETVYGLGANAFSDDAVKEIFKAKNRPCDNPLIVHLADKKDIELVAAEVTPLAQKLIDSFMPGPLTIILKKKKHISTFATAGLKTVGIRIPSNTVAREFIKACRLPIAAPSANVSSRPSPTTAMHVYQDLKGKIPAIIDGGDCEIGIESTVLDLSENTPRILRPGKVSEQDIIRVCGEVLLGGNGENRSPGIKYRHYAPTCPCKLLEHSGADYIKSEYNKYSASGKNVWILCYEDNTEALKGFNIINMGKDNKSAAALLFKALRQAEKAADIILIEKPKTDEMEKALLNRILKACAPSNAF